MEHLKYSTQIKALNIQDENAINRFVETEEVVNEVSSVLPNYTKKILISLFLFFLASSILLYVQFINSNEIPEYSYDQEWFTMAKNGYILGVCEGDLRFHSLLVDAAHNSRLSELYTRANIPLSGVNYIWKMKEQRQEVFITDSNFPHD